MSYLLILIGLVVLIFGGDILVQGASGIAKKLRLSPLVIGMTVVAFGTSAPELMVSLKAAMLGSSEIAMGNVVGSNIANIAFILGVTCLIFPLVIDVNSRNIDWPVMFGASMLLFIWAFDGVISRIEGIMMFLMLVIFTWLIIRNSRKKNKKTPREEGEKVPNIYLSIGKNLVGLVMLYFGSKWLVEGAISVAQDFKIEERIIGVTIIAFGTSVPELAASVIAAVKKETEISIGNIIGSNIFNILCVIGLTATIQPIKVSEKMIFSDMIWMLGIAFLLGIILFLWKKINRWHGFVLLATYAAYIAILVLSMDN
jgi:cation:H+ antiporter